MICCSFLVSTLDEFVEVLGFLLQRLLAVRELLLEVFEVLFLAGKLLLLLLDGIFAFFEAAFLFAEFGAGDFHLAGQFFATPEGIVAGLQLGFAHDLFGVASGLFQKFVAARFGAACFFGIKSRVTGWYGRWAKTAHDEVCAAHAQ